MQDEAPIGSVTRAPMRTCVGADVSDGSTALIVRHYVQCIAVAVPKVGNMPGFNERVQAQQTGQLLAIRTNWYQTNTK